MGIVFCIFVSLLFSTTCVAKENVGIHSLQIEDEIQDPRIEVWVGIRTTSGIIPIPAGTYIPGASAYYVRLLQAALNTIGYNCGTVDGVFGANTRNAIMNFQRDTGITVDGIAGRSTWLRISDKLYELGVYVPF